LELKILKGRLSIISVREVAGGLILRYWIGGTFHKLDGAIMQ